MMNLVMRIMITFFKKLWLADTMYEYHSIPQYRILGFAFISMSTNALYENHILIPVLQRPRLLTMINLMNEWMDKLFHPTLYNACDYSSMLGMKLIHVSKSNHRSTIRGIVCAFIINAFVLTYFGYQLISPSVVYMRQWIGSALFQVMAWRRKGDKPLPAPMLIYC